MYPRVASEHETLEQVLAGASLARYGDGEFNLCGDRRIPSQAADPILCARLRAILADSGECLVGIPNIHSETPKQAFWRKYLNADILLADRPYVSAFISRPDSAPWINTREYWQAVESLWASRAVTLVRGTARSLTAGDLEPAARAVTEIVVPAVDAFADYDDILESIGRPELALLCVGPTATVLAVDLCARGVQAVDVGHLGMFLKKARRGDPMVVTEVDKAVCCP